MSAHGPVFAASPEWAAFLQPPHWAGLHELLGG